jgi:hypothetical protein
MPETTDRQYLGDGVYAGFDGYHIVLTAENGICATNTIYLEPQVIAAFNRYHNQLIAKYTPPAQEQTNETPAPDSPQS